MNHYFVNRKPNNDGYHEVHNEECKNLPISINCFYLGMFITCEEAMLEAASTFQYSNGCHHCIAECCFELYEF